MQTKALATPEADITPLQSAVVPRYRQIEAILRDQIWLGELNPGDQIPTEEDLCRRFLVSRATVRQALRILEQDGLIYREIGRGTFVNPAAEQGPQHLLSLTPEKLSHPDIFERITIQRTGTYAARGDIQAALQVTDGAELFFFLRVFYFHGEPVGGEKVYVLPSVGAALSREEMIEPRIATCIARHTQCSTGRAKLRIGAIVSDARHSIRFDTFSGAPLISIFRTTYDDSEQPLEHGHMLFRCDRCQLSLENP